MLAIGAAASLLLSLATAPFGLGGAVAGVVFVSLLALTSGIAGTWLSVGIIVDQWRGRVVSGRRVLLAGALLLLTLLLSNTQYETLPINAEVPGYGDEQAPALANRKIQ